MVGFVLDRPGWDPVSYRLKPVQGRALGFNGPAKRTDRMLQLVNTADTESQTSGERPPKPDAGPPGIKFSISSILPVSAAYACRRFRITSNVPSPFHCENNRQTVCQGPNSSGKSRQGEFVRRTHKTPSTIVRRSRGARPVHAGVGNKSLINYHCSSVSRCLSRRHPFIHAL